MYTTQSVNSELLDAVDMIKDNRVSIVAQFSERYRFAHHSGLLISYKGKHEIFHYNRDAVELAELPAKYPFILFFKQLKNIREEQVEAFIAHCRRIAKKATPNYGYFFSKSYYDQNGNFVSNDKFEEYMTCVGFCIKVVQGFLMTEYIATEEWDESTKENAADYFKGFVEEENKARKIPIDEKLFRSNLKRITPTQYTSSGFYDKLPVLRVDVETIQELVHNCMDNRVAQKKKALMAAAISGATNS